MADPTIDKVFGEFLPAGEAARLANHLKQLPDPASALRSLQAVREETGRPIVRSRVLNFLTLAGFSPYLASVLVQNPEFLEALPAGGAVPDTPTREDLEETLARFVHLNAAHDPSLVLRRFKKRELLRIALADLLGHSDLPAVTRALSLLADVLVDKAVRMARSGLEARFGRPACRDDQGHPEEATFAVVALGKLGGEELNYSSDIDLLYLFSRDGETSGTDLSGAASISNREFFTRLATEVTRLIAGGGPEGQVFRVDLGLRPGGGDGEIAISLGAAVAYYRNWAEAWERQALIKARPASGDLVLGRRFVESVEALVYAAAPDPYLVLEIGAMKDRIDARLSSAGRSESDIKLGRGGIRELEFGIQALQLQHGGRDPWLRHGNTLLALHRIADKGFVSYQEYAELSKAYVFLRDLEHRLQLGQNRQTASLPENPRELLLVARRMRLHEPEPGREVGTLLETLHQHREVVRRFYDSVTGSAAQAPLEEESADLWLDRLDDESLKDRLQRSGIEDPIAALRPVRLIRKQLQAAAAAIEIRRALRRSGPHLLAAVASSVNPRRALVNLERLFSSLGEEIGGLLRFLSRREVLAPTVRLLGRSDLLAGILIRRPGILDALEDRGRIVRTPGRGDYLRVFLPVLRWPGDARARAAELRRRHQEALATIAIRDINRQATLREVLKSLSDLAEAVLETTVRLARQDLTGPGLRAPRALRLAALGLGRLGYREMDYGSDLDLVFVYDAPADRADLRRPARVWCERVVRILSTLSRDGQLYRVDLRLRPSGGEGELVTSLQGLRDYLHGAAEVWEMQAFLKARPVAGDAVLGARASEAVETAILESGRTRGPRALTAEVGAMRRRLASLAGRGDRPSVKLSAGGLYDLHFIIELLQLRHGIGSPADKDTLRLLTHLHRLGHLSDGQLRILYQSYLFFRALDHEMRLIYERPLKNLPDDPVHLSELALAFASDPAAGSPEHARLLKERFHRHAGAVRGVYDEIVR
ncbi:MAG: bifunctional [glutamate--ammonia ligase]-adenylyl-L-tyrosine phosphorylase/[glutamate--ammonia-ligase] adenylyltransferase [Acidobacteriota bacterium]